MVKNVKRLGVREIERLTKPGLHHDGGGLYVQITRAGVKSFAFRFMLKGRARTMGLGAVSETTLAEARAAAEDARRKVEARQDPIEIRKAERAQVALAEAQSVPFRQAAQSYIETKRPGWKNPKHAEQWLSTLETYAFPTLGNLSVASIDTALVLKVIEPIWKTKTETASRLRGRIEAILSRATVLKQRSGPNPAQWRGHLSEILPAPRKVRPVRHHPALPYAQIPEFMAKLRAVNTIAARALEWTILCAARTTETTGATWPEISEAERLWTIAGGRMKGGQPHRVPLCDRALEILRDMRALDARHVFPGQKRSKSLSNAGMETVLERLGYDAITVHGMRSTFRDFAEERTNYGGNVAEAALAHTVKSKTERAYRRGDVLDKRRLLMNAWADYCLSDPVAESAKVVAIRA